MQRQRKLHARPKTLTQPSSPQSTQHRPMTLDGHQGLLQSNQLRHHLQLTSPQSILHLQRTIGNQAVLKLLKQRVPSTQLPNATHGTANTIQRVTIGEDDVDSDLWDKISKFDEDEWGSIDTEDMKEKDLTDLIAILRAAGTNEAQVILAKIERERGQESQPLDFSSVTKGLKVDSSMKLPESYLSSGRSYKEKREVVPPKYPEAKKIWEEQYNMDKKTYKGLPKEVMAQLRQDPALKLLFPEGSQVALEIMGFVTMSQPHPTDGSKEMEVELSFFDISMFNIHTRFPNGMQDTNLSYKKEGNQYSVYDVHRHRSMKEKGSPANFFIGMIEEQATGVSKLEKLFSYHSDAIKNPSDNAYGYNVWPKMGFDGDIEAKYLIPMLNETDEKLAAGVKWLSKFYNEKGTPNFTDLFTVKDNTIYNQLKELWRKHGGYVKVAFDVTKGSKSWQALARYKASKH